MSRGADDDGNGSRTRRRCRRSVAETNHRRRPDHSLKVGRHLFTGDTLFPGGPGLTGWPLSDFPTIIDSIRQKRRHGVSDDDMLHAVRHHWRARLSLTRSKGTHIVLHRTGAGRSQRHGWRSVLFVRTPDIGGPIPVVSSASIGIRSNGASVGSVLNAQAVTEAVASNSEGPRNQAARIGFARPEVAMRIFISYRRDDTAGRAGRLFDQLVARFGSRSVFQDVAAMTPGADFTQQVADEIANSDAVLVVIGPAWLTLVDAHGRRKLDDPGDYVCAEIGVALAAGVAVVPVLVGEAQMPLADELPDGLRPLAHRHAVRLRDESWHRDVDALIRRLDSKPATARSRLRGAAVVVVLVLLALVGWAWAGRDRGGGDGDASPPDPGPCPRPGDSWQPIELTADPTNERTDAVGRSFELTVEDARYRPRGSDVQIVVALRLHNSTPPEEDGAFYVTASDFGEMSVDGASIGPRTCFSASPQNVIAGVSSELLVGFDGAYEPGSSLVIETTFADLDVTVADG